MASASSSSPFFGIREEDESQLMIKQQHSSSTPTTSSTAPQKKKRNLPGTPNPDAEVIALSPKTLMATNRFICEVCNKGFQREQNLQLHRRGHNLPWKLKQKSSKEVKRKVYLCPESTCVHHDPSRALGDLTGIKKHFCRKHGEKKWKCDKCSKRYAVQSDWKAHSKTCGTREYRCDCGTLFSRRDSFITHRAFCDALAQESARLPGGLNTLGTHLYGSTNMGLGLSQMGSQISSVLQNHNSTSTDLLKLGGTGGSQFDHLLSPSNLPLFRPPQNPAFFLPGSNHNFHEDQSLMQNKPFHGLMHLPDLQNNTIPSSSSAAAAAVPNLFNLSFFSNSSNTGRINNSSNANTSNSHLSSSGLLMPEQMISNSNAGSEGATVFSSNMMGDHMAASLYNSPAQSDSLLPQMSATALLQKAAQMGATTSNKSTSLLRGFGSSSSSGLSKPDRPDLSGSFRSNFGGGDSMRSQIENQTHLHDLMNSLANGGSNLFGAGSGGVPPFGSNCTSGGHEQETGFGGFNSGRLTRDFLGVGGMMRNIGGGGGDISQREQQHGINIGSMDSDLKSAAGGSQSFGGGSLQ